MAGAAAAQSAKALEDAARPGLVQALHGGILNSLRNSPDKQLECVQILVKILKNAMDNPNEEKYRTIRCTTNAFKTKVTNVKGGEDFLQSAGWYRSVVDFEPHFSLADAAAASGPVARLALHLLEQSLAETQAKKERTDKERWLKKNEAALRKDDVLRSLEDDKRRRAEAAAVRAAASPGLSPPAAGAAGGAGAGALSSPRGGAITGGGQQGA